MQEGITETTGTANWDEWVNNYMNGDSKLRWWMMAGMASIIGVLFWNNYSSNNQKVEAANLLSNQTALSLASIVSKLEQSNADSKDRINKLESKVDVLGTKIDTLTGLVKQR